MITFCGMKIEQKISDLHQTSLDEKLESAYYTNGKSGLFSRSVSLRNIRIDEKTFIHFTEKPMEKICIL